MRRSRHASISRSAPILALLAVLLSPAAASAADPPPLGSPIDRFSQREVIGQEGMLALGDGAGGTALELRRLETQTRGGEELRSAVSEFDLDVGAGPNGFAEADLDMVRDDPASDLRDSLEPGIAFAGEGTDLAGCSAGPVGSPFCLTWLRPSYENAGPAAQHRFTGFDAAYAINLGRMSDVAPGTDVAVAPGTLAPGGGPSVVVAWIQLDGATPELRVANVFAARDGSGRVQSLEMGQVRDLGAVHQDAVQGTTSPALAVGDFGGVGSDQVAVAWAPADSANGSRKFRVAMYDGDAGGGLRSVIAPQDIAAQINGSPNASPGQIGPGAVALRDVREPDDRRDRLVIGPGIQGDSGLYMLTPSEDSPGTFASTRLRDNFVVGAYNNYHGELESVGDLDGDGLDELLSAADPGISGDGTNSILEILNLGTGGGFQRTWFRSVPGPVDAAVLDARATRRQVIAPVPGKVDTARMPQIALSSLNVTLGSPFFGRFMLSFFDIGADGAAYENSSVDVPLGPFAGIAQDLESPELVAFALDGRLELGDPVKGDYTQLEPTVVLNSPPTHFDILDGTPYDANFCYEGDQYAVPPVCFFSSTYARVQSSTTEVSSQSTEDWAVSAKATADFNVFGVDVSAEIRGGYGEKFTEIDEVTTTDTVSVTVKALNTDKIYAIKRTYDTLEYPIYQPGATGPQGFVLAATPHTISKRWVDSSSPDATDIRVNHQPGNILSYPENVTKAENPFIATTSGVDTFAQDEFELSDSSDYQYKLTKQRMDADSASTQTDWNVGATIGAGGEVLGIVNVKLEVQGDYRSSELTTTKTTVGDTTELTSTMLGIDESIGEIAYTVKPFAYWTSNATLVLDYAVEPSLAPPGAPKTWWQQQYGSKPDITLNLPRLLDFEEQAGISSDAARFISPGVFVEAGDCATSVPIGEAFPKPDETLCLRAQIENYSLKDQTGNTRVEFYDADPDVGGELIGSDVVGSIPARDSAQATLEWTPDERFAGSSPRIFVKVDADDDASEIHETNNKGFRGYRALTDTAVAPRAPEDVLVEEGDGNTLEVEWSDPLAATQPAGHQWLVRAYPDEGGAPVEVTVGGDESTATIPDVAPGRYRVAIFSVAGAETSPASHPAEPVDVNVDVPGAPENVGATAGDTTIELDWDEPSFTGGGPIDSYRILEFRDPGQTFPEALIDTTVTGSLTGLRLSGLTNDRPYRFTIQAINSAGPGGISEATDPVTPSRSEPEPAIELTRAPEDGTYTGSNVTVAFETEPADADTECVIDGLGKPCRSPLRLSELEDGSHTLQVVASSPGGEASTPLISWNVDGIAPEAAVRPLKKLIRKDDPSLGYSGADQGGSGLAGYEVRTRKSGRRGKFSTEAVLTDPSTENSSSSVLEIPAGDTVCAAVRSLDGAGNSSAWSKEKCTTRPFEETALRKEGKGWKKKRGKAFSDRRVLQTKRSGPSLTFLLGRSSKVKVLAGRCSACGKLAVEVRGHRRKVIDLSKTRKAKSRITVFNAKWPKKRDGRLRLISLGGGQVRVDGVAVWRTAE